ncbi:MAG: DegT/DnrJ/EryC1/StrS family aminotransferase [Candidatus Omnitrophica bacterium]|nr:DegT/DnrJ/EryC1/StrS family aminotransferase [Candidatus Omnitrophota bacterium]
MVPRRNKILSLKLTKDMLRYALERGERERDYIPLFEKEAAGYLGVKYCALVSSGRKGMELVIKSFSLPKGSQIILPAYTLKDLPFLIKALGYEPVFVDVEPGTGNMDPALVGKKVNGSTAVIIPTHLFGLPCRIDEIQEIAKNKGIKVIEDCAHAFGADYKGRKAGTFGDAGFFSLELTKPINTFGGGLVATNNKYIYDFIKKETSGYPKATKRVFTKVINSLVEDAVVHSPLYSLLGFLFYFDSTKKAFANLYRGVHKSIRKSDSQYSNFQAYMGRIALARIDERNSGLFEKVKKLRGMLNKDISYPLAGYPYNPAFYHFIIRTKHNCEEIRKQLLKRGIDAGIKDEITDNCPLYFGCADQYPNANSFYNTAIQIPMSREFRDSDLAAIAGKINDIVLKIA